MKKKYWELSYVIALCCDVAAFLGLVVFFCYMLMHHKTRVDMPTIRVTNPERIVMIDQDRIGVFFQHGGITYNFATGKTRTFGDGVSPDEAGHAFFEALCSRRSAPGIIPGDSVVTYRSPMLWTETR